MMNLKKIIFLTMLFSTALIHGQNHFYTDAAKDILKLRFENGYSAGTGFYDDISRTITEVSNFTADPDQYRPVFDSTGYMPFEGQNLHTSALYAYAIDSAALANIVATELLGIVDNNDLYTTWWNDSDTYRWDSDYSLMIQCAKAKKMQDSYYLIKDLQTTLSATNENDIESWFSRLATLAYDAVSARLESYLGVDWENVGITTFNPEGVYPSGYDTPIQDASGNDLFTMAWAHDIFNNRNWDIIEYIHANAIEEADATKEYWAREFVKIWLKYAVFPDGTLAEMFRNDDGTPNKGIWYSWITTGGVVQMAHLDAMNGSYPNDLLYDYSTTEGIEYNSTTYTTSGYVGTSTTDGVAEKNILKVIKNITNYYRSDADGGWNNTRFYESDDGLTLTALDAEGYSQPSVVASVANLYYKDNDLVDFYSYDTSVGYPVKQSILSGALAGAGYDEDYGPWGNLIQGSAWYEMEDYFFNTNNQLFDKVYFGSTEIEAIYNGSTLIYEKQ